MHISKKSFVWMYQARILHSDFQTPHCIHARFCKNPFFHSSFSGRPTKNTGSAVSFFFMLVWFKVWKTQAACYRPTASISLHVTVYSDCLSLFPSWVNVDFPRLWSPIQQLLWAIHGKREPQFSWVVRRNVECNIEFQNTYINKMLKIKLHI